MPQVLNSLPDEIEKGLIGDAKEIAEWGKEGYGDDVWTKKVKLKFAERGRALNYFVCATGHNDRGRNEWLYDLVWLQRQDGTANKVRRDDGTVNLITDVPLILESEWNNETHIVEDFEKLLVGRARHRVMVFQASSTRRLAEITKKLVGLAASCPLTQPGDRYLFLGLNNTEYVFVHEVCAF